MIKMHLTDIHTHFPRPGIPSVVDVSGRVDFMGSEHEYFTAGLHPKSIAQDWEQELSDIERLASLRGFVGVGECGLDKFAEAPRDLQMEVFMAQLFWAQRIMKPVIIHCVRLYSDVMSLIKKTNFKFPAIFHGYNGNPETTSQLLKLPNVHFSFSISSFSMPETSGMKSLPLIPPERLFTETDCDRSADVAEVIEKIATIKGITASSLQETVYENFMKIVSGR